MNDTDAHPLVGRDVMVGTRAARITGVERAEGIYSLRYENGGDEDGHCYRDEFYVLPTQKELDRVEASAYEAGWNDAKENDHRMASALQKLADGWRQSADEDERYLNRAHASEIHDIYASIRINREHADAVTELLNRSKM